MSHPAAARVHATSRVPAGVPAHQAASRAAERSEAPSGRGRARTALPAAAGVGLRAPHVAHVLAERPPVPWLEVHSENYFADGGPALAALERIRAHYPLSLHGVGLSLGSVDPLDRSISRSSSDSRNASSRRAISEHLCWSGVDARHFNDLLPLPYTEEALRHVCERIDAAQDISRPAHPRRERVELLRISREHDPRRRVRGGRRRAHRVRAAARRQQHLRERLQPRHRPRRVSRRDPAGRGGRDSSGGIRRERTVRHRHPRRARRARSVVAVRARPSRGSDACRP